MKVTSISNKTNYDMSSCKNKVQCCPANINETPKDSVSFSGVKGGGFKNKLTELFKWIDKKGFFIEFLIVDTISMIVPRVAVGLGRDQEKTGHLNYQAGAEEAGREILSGPSMNLIPMGILAAVAALKPASHMGKGTISGFTQNMHKVLDKTTSCTDMNQKDLNKKLAEELFDDAFGSLKNNEAIAEEFKGEFVKRLVDSTTITKKFFNNEAFKDNSDEFQKLIVKINNKGVSDEIAPSNSYNLKLGTDAKDGKRLSNLSGKNLFEDFHNYSKDVLQKLSDYKPSEPTVEKAKQFVKNREIQRINLKTASAVSAFFAVGGFLLYLPKLYQRGKTSPAEASAKRIENGTQGGTNENK